MVPAKLLALATDRERHDVRCQAVALLEALGVPQVRPGWWDLGSGPWTSDGRSAERRLHASGWLAVVVDTARDISQGWGREYTIYHPDGTSSSWDRNPWPHIDRIVRMNLDRRRKEQAKRAGEAAP